MIETTLSSERVPPTSAPSPVLLAPLAVEAAALRLGMGGLGRVARVGMGPDRAAASLARLGELPAAAPVAVVGFGGGLHPGQRPGDVVVASELVTEDSSLPRESLDAALAESVAQEIRHHLRRVETGTVVCCRRIVPAGELPRLAGASGALCCEMESAWLLPLAKGRRFAVVRVILDTPGRGLFTPWTLVTGPLAFAHLKSAAAATARALRDLNQ